MSIHTWQYAASAEETEEPVTAAEHWLSVHGLA